MKNVTHKNYRLAPFDCCVARPAHAAVTLTVSPSSTSNNYAGFITLQIGGLTTGQSVVVQRFLDLNTNGVIDPGEPMIDMFPLTDGQASIIGGATNYSVPYDQNPTNGAITTTLNFALPMNFENITAPSIYQILNTSGQSLVTAPFTVTNGTQSQTITGTVFRGVTPVANALVGADIQPSGGLLAVAVSDNRGHYTLKLPVGTYQILSLVTNAYFDRSLAPTVTLTNGMTSTNNLYVTNGTVTISGKVYDSTNINNGLGAIFMTVQSGNYLEALFTSSNGTYSASVNPGYWTPQVEEDRMARTGYVFPQNISQVNTTTRQCAQCQYCFSQSQRAFLRADNRWLEPPLCQCHIRAGMTTMTIKGLYESRGYSDTNGNYGFATLAETNGWYASPDPLENAQFANDIVSTGTNWTFSTNQAVRQDFVVLPAIGQITGHVKNNSGQPVVGVSVGGNAFIGGNQYQSSSADTDTNGYYALGVAAGAWSVFFDSSGNSQENITNQNYEDLYGPYLVNVPPTNAVQNITLYPIGAAVLTNSGVSPPGQYNLNVYGENNVTYTLESSPDLIHWTQLYSFQLTTNPFPVSDSSATNRTSFYRVVIVNE